MLDLFFSTAIERYNIFLRREAGMPQPWTADKWFAKYRFCNVHRSNDITTRWFKTNVIDVKESMNELLFASIGFRWFSRISTGQLLLDLLLKPRAQFDAQEWRTRLMNAKGRLFTSAFITNGENWETRWETTLRVLEQLREVEFSGSSKDIWHQLQIAHGVGPFMAMEAVKDAQYRWLHDKDDWVNLGPGAKRGLALDGVPRRSTSRLDRCHEIVEIAKTRWPSEWEVFDLNAVEHWLCEVYKYHRAENGGTQPKRLYVLQSH